MDKAHSCTDPDASKALDLAAAFDDAPALIWVTGPVEGAIYFNRTWLEFTGRTLAEEAGKGWTAGLHPEDRKVLETYSAAFADRKPVTLEYRLRRHDGRWRWMEDKGRPRFDAEGRFVGYVGCCVDITERKEAEAALRRSEERLQLAHEAAGVGTYDWDIQDNRITWSSEMFRLHDIDPSTPQDRIYEVWLERLHPEDRERADRETKDFVETADDLAIEFRVIDREGAVRWIHGRGRMVRDADGRPIRMIGVNLDITDRKQAEQALRESEQRLRDIAENFPGIIFRRITYPDGRFEYPYFSGMGQNVFHLPRERLEQIRTMEDVAQLIHYEDFQEMRAKFEEAASRLAPLELEGRVIGDDGEVRWLRTISRPRPRDDGALVWDGVMIDVTERHLQEGERERAAAMLRMAMEVAGIGVWELDPESRTVLGSPVTRAAFGLPADADWLPVDAYIEAVHPDDADRVERAFRDAANTQSSMADEYRVRAEDGTDRWLSSSGSYVRLADGTERLIGAVFDVTDRKRREEEVQAALDQQRMLLRELNHRVKNNLQMVTSILQLQASRTGTSEAAEELRQAIDRVQSIADLHAQFGFDGNIGQIDFGDYLEQLCAKLRSAVLAETPVEIRCSTTPCLIDLDKAVPLGLIVNELVTNSLKYAFPAGAGGTIEVALEACSDGEVTVRVSDNGVGLPDGSGNTQGLGTQLVKGLARQIGATIADGEGPGTMHVITAPITRSG